MNNGYALAFVDTQEQEREQREILDRILESTRKAIAGNERNRHETRKEVEHSNWRKEDGSKAGVEIKGIQDHRNTRDPTKMEYKLY